MAEGTPLPAVYLESYFDMRRSFWEDAEKRISSEEAKQLSGVAQQVFSTAPNSIEAAHLRCIESGYQQQHVQEVLELTDSQPGDYLELMLPLKYASEDESVREDLLELERRGKLRSDDMRYHRILVHWLPANSIIVTNGFDDTYCTLLETLRQNRSDVFVLTLDLIHAEGFNQRIVRELRGDSQTQKVKAIDLYGENRRTEMLDLLREVSTRPVHFALTLPPSWLADQNDLAQEGLALAKTAHYSVSPHQLHAQALASVDLSRINPDAPVARNYLPLLLSWHKACQLLGHTDQAERIANKVKQLAVKTADANTVLKMLDE